MRTDPNRRKHVPADARPDEQREGTRHARRAARAEAREPEPEICDECHDPRPNIHPTITADQLAAYLVSPPTRRRSLLEVAKYSGIFADPWVKARAVAVDVMLGRVLPDELRDHAPMRGGRALAAFFSAWHRDRTIRDVPHSPVLEVVGVKVTAAAPDVLTRHRVGHRVRLGGVAFAFEPRAPERARRTRCALMHRALERLCGPDSFTTVEDAAVLSLASGELLSGGPTTVVWRDIEAACAEVRRVWSSV